MKTKKMFIIISAIIIVIFVLTACGGKKAETATQPPEVDQTMPTSDSNNQPPEVDQTMPTSDSNNQPTCTTANQASWTSPVDNMPLVCVPQGDFTMGGNDEQAYDDEKPIHKVTLDAFWIDQYEVSNGQYVACISAGACENPGSMNSTSHSYYLTDPVYEDYPALNMSWNNAVAYCEWAERQLPTEAQWEKAARGTEGDLYPWGSADPTCNLANFMGCEGTDAVAVDSHPNGASPFGALNMVGNVQEWVSDFYDAKFYVQSMNSTNPEVTSGGPHVLRGAAFGMAKERMRTSARKSAQAGFFDFNTGFRCALPAD